MILQMTKDLVLFLTGDESRKSTKANPDTAEQTESPKRNDETSLENAKRVTVFPPSKTRNDEDKTKFNIRMVKNSNHTKASAPKQVETKTDHEEAKAASGRSQPATHQFLPDHRTTSCPHVGARVFLPFFLIIDFSPSQWRENIKRI